MTRHQMSNVVMERVSHRQPGGQCWRATGLNSSAPAELERLTTQYAVGR